MNQFSLEMKDKIIAALRTKYQRFGLSNEAVDRIASAKEKTVTNEEDIEGAIADAQTMELIANELQKSADAERRTRSDLQKSFDDYKKNHPDQKLTGDNDDDPEWKKAFNEIKAKIEAREAKEKSAATLSSVTAALEKAGCSNKEILSLTLKGFALGENETEEAAVTRIKSDYDASIKKIFGDGSVPPSGGGQDVSDEELSAKFAAFAKKKGLVKSGE